MLKRYNLYMIKLISWPTLLVTLCLTSIIWLTQALRYIDFIVNRGLSIGDFMYLAMLLLPSLLMVVLPVSFFIGVLFAYQKLASDSELVVLKASGLSSMQLARPAIVTGVSVTALVALIAFYIMPISKHQFKETQNFLRDNYSSVLLQEEVFNSPIPGLTVFVRERDDAGNMKGILVHDNRLKGMNTTMMADEGKLIQTAKGPRFQLTKGLRQERNEKGQMSWLHFDSYGLDLSFYTNRAGKRKKGEDEYLIHELFDLANHTDDGKRNALLAQAHQRLTWPLVSLALGLLAATGLLKSDFNRRRSWKLTGLISFAAVLFVIAMFGVANAMVKQPELMPMIYILSIGAILSCLFILIRERAMTPSNQQDIPSLDSIGSTSS